MQRHSGTPSETQIGLDKTAPSYNTQVEHSREDFLTQLRSKLRINIIEEVEDRLIFDLIGVEAPIANALRRILLAEIPTMAIEHVFISDNTSVIQDEVLSHRIGLVPLLADPRCFEEKQTEEDATDLNTLVFKLDVMGEPVKKGSKGETRYTHVYSGHLQWVPQGSQAERFYDAPIRPVHDDILLAKLKPGQRITLEAHAIKGTGQEHAKWSPVATASYRLMPHVEIADPIYDEEAEELKQISDVFDVQTNSKGRKEAVVSRPRQCNMSREILRDPRFANRINISRINDHFIFSVESVGMLDSRTLVKEACRILKEKCQNVQNALEEWSASTTHGRA
eukprot:gb/GECG01008004.1/.p1 GENE.gb/GECG01008004.1/~~gb/GECG01008004.1/.p1  ORF type:complete len:337 (+),score=35.18 gb/GECG01008004.1/:1-1011(+)